MARSSTPAPGPWESLPPGPDHPDQWPALQRLRHLRSPQLQNYRDLVVSLPPGAGQGGGPWPVVYLQDGQNLFDHHTSYAGAWDLLPVLAGLAREGLEMIVVGISNKGSFRRYEYSPFRDAEHGGGDGERYLDFLTETVMPLIAGRFPVATGPAATVVAGSSLGGLVSLYALLQRPEVFGAAGALSPSAWFADEALVELATARPAPSGRRLYLDVGTGEDARLVGAVRRLHDGLTAGGWDPGGRYWYLEEEEGTHHESAWGRRFRHALPFLLGRDPVPPPTAGTDAPPDPDAKE